MNNVSLIDELDTGIDQMIAGGRAQAASAELAGLLEIAYSLRALPRPDFKMQLSRELAWEASGRLVSNGKRSLRVAVPKPAVLTAIFGDGYGIYPVRRANFVASLTLHAAMIALVGLGFLAVKNNPQVRARSVMVDVMPISLPPGARTPHGGGGSGGHDQAPESKGVPPRQAKLQIVPPTVEQPPKESRLPTPPAIVVPEMNLPNTQMGDQLSTLTRLSNGTRAKAGIGSGEGSGVGSGSGSGYGPGAGGGFGGGAYRPGNGVTAPRAIYTPEPEFSEEARKVKRMGMVILRAVIGVDGRPRDIRVERSLGMGLDEKAIETVRNWRFEPGKKDGRPVPVEMNIIVDYSIF